MSEALETTKQTRFRSLTVTLAIAFVTLSVVILLVASSLQLYFNFLSQQEVVVGEQRLIAQGAANKVTLFIQERFSELESAAKFSSLIGTSVDEAEQSLERLLGVELVFRQLALLDGQGEVIAKASRLSQAARKGVTDRLEAGALAQTRQNGRYISPVYIDDETFEPLVVMAVPVLDIFGDYQGTLVAEANLKFMWDLVDRLEIGDEGVAYVVDRQGNLLAYGDVGRVIAGENLSQLKEVAEFVNQDDLEIETKEDDINFTTGIEDTNVLSTYVPLDVPDWAVVTELPVFEAYQGLIENARIFAVIIVIVGVLAAFAGAYLARRLAAPVQQLTDTASQIAEGDLKLQAKAEGPTEVRQLAVAFNRMTGQLNELFQSLEDRVAARTQRLESVATLSEQLAAILEVDQLLNDLVNQVKDRLGYYHAHVYLIDDEAGRLVMTAGAGTAGLQMKAQGHGIALNAATSLVARAARTNQIVRVDNVREAEDWLPNALLPDTYSEMAVPIILEGQVVGVLDVQQDRVAGLDESDASLLRSLANQVAVAIRNARLFREVETALAEAHAAQERYVAQSWKKERVASQRTERLYTRPDIPELSEAILTETKKQALAQPRAAVIALDDEEDSPKPLVAPVALSGKTIGTLQLHKIDYKDSGQPWTEQDLALVEAVLDQVAQTVENLRLFDETRERAGREATIREITDKLRATPNMKRLMEVAAQELGQRLPGTHIRLELGTKAERPTNGNSEK